MIFETAIGDAYALAWEFVPESMSPKHDWNGYKTRPKTGNFVPLRAGQYTDDTMRTLANARVILSGDVTSPLAYVREIKAGFRADKRGGWSSKFYNFLIEHENFPDTFWLSALRGRNTNGALMGAAVMGMLPSPEEAWEAGYVQASVTHDAEGARYAAALSVTAHGLRTGLCDPLSVHDVISRHDPITSNEILDRGRIETRVDMSAGMTCAAVLQILRNAWSLRDVMNQTIMLGGDTDSVAAAAFGIASMTPNHYDLMLPDWAVRDLEGGEIGPLLDMDKSLGEIISPCPLLDL